MKFPSQTNCSHGQKNQKEVLENPARARLNAASEKNHPGEELKAPHILVIDDDPLFRATFYRAATERKLPVTVCSSLREMEAMADSNLFDVAIIDYYLDDIKTKLRGIDIARALKSTPVILISSSDQWIEKIVPFPHTVRKFINKKMGVNEIINTALLTVEQRT